MKIKHWQGYGAVNATKISRKSRDGITTLVVHVSGNHECGLARDDKYTLSWWLVKRFDRSFTDDRSILSVRMEPGYDHEKQEETCDYTITYRTPETA